MFAADQIFRRSSVAAIPYVHPGNNVEGIKKCPFMNAEHQRIKEKHRTLASTGCSKDFCQAGRAIHTDEPRVGENRSLEIVCQEAAEFLRDLYDEGFFHSEAQFEARLQEVHAEILYGATGGIAREHKLPTRLGGNWTQSHDELEFGIRRAWRNARKCIARNHAKELKLCDLRSMTTSVDMAKELGPMIWDNQILDFAGYKMDDGTVLGDLANVDLTTAIMELGWTPPQTRGPQDLLPLVTMAEGDKPAMMEIPAPLSNLVNISHPQFPSFAALNLKWKAAPALTRLGFDIGGVQYTAAPFIGWFMDAKIGVRDLADTFRYNVLPDIVQAIGLANGKLQDGVDSIEDLPEYEQLAMLSRAQSELNYAVQWSFNQTSDTMTDSLTASKKWCKFDDEFKEKNGYRLPADPYWLAPPQGSIIPVWHRGGAPNYQPKPMISKHVQDPVKAWRRERHMWQLVPEPPKLMTFSQTAAAFPRLVEKKMAEVPVTEIEDSSDDDSDAISLTSTLSEQKTIAIYFCSAGTIAEKLAKRLHKRIEALVKVSLNVALQPRVECLNKLKATDMTADKIFLLVVSSTGKGEVPPNGSGFLRVTRLSSIEGMSFSVFGNGDSRYSATYNGAAKAVHQHMQDLGGRPLIRKVFRGDIAVEPMPYTAVNNWWNSLEPRVYDLINKDEAIVVDYGSKLEALNETITVVNDAVDRLIDHGRDLSFFKDAFTVAAQPVKSDPAQRSLNLSIDIGSTRYEDQNCIQILPLNHPSKVDRALKVLKLDGAATLDLSTHKDNPTYAIFLTKSADLEVPFKTLDWLLKTGDSSASLVKELLSNLTVLDTLELLAKTNLLSRFLTKPSLVQDIILSIPLLPTRTYSVASSLSAKPTPSSAPDANIVDIMLKRIPNGRFSSTFLTDHSTSPAKLQYRIVDSVTGPRLRHLSAQTNKPLVIVATGAGFGPVKCLLQSRIAAARCAKSATPAFENMSLFLGFHPTDIPLVKPILDDAEELGLIDGLHIVESNPEKKRVQDLLVREDMAGEIRENLLGEKEGWVFVCASEGAAKGTRGAFQRVLGMDGNENFWAKKYLEEIF
ncbi:hypothetical protein JMJ35_007883 [Cladonia borealis]|uniref:nitric-oxide synthase (NADPH) n=1 Tax=Cladonia borealis TaxID=184061 RepID=A0AA39V356_9LECA|nr:hypothetical protein JMJ35_007883 [Cladonia borealis]